MIARKILDTTFISLHTPHFLVRTYSWCKQDFYLKWETVDSIVDEWKSYLYIFGNTTHTSETSLYILLHPELWVEIRDLSSQITCTSLSVMLQTLLLVQSEQFWDGVYYLTKHVNLKCWVKMVDSFVHEFPKWYLLALILHTFYTSLQECFHWHLLFQYRDYLIMNIYSWFKQQISLLEQFSIHLWGKWISLDIFKHNNTHYTQNCICHTKLIYKYKNIFFSGNLHCPIHCVSL
jgi:hypothetical protein